MGPFLLPRESSGLSPQSSGTAEGEPRKEETALGRDQRAGVAEGAFPRFPLRPHQGQVSPGPLLSSGTYVFPQ